MKNSKNVIPPIHRLAAIDLGSNAVRMEIVEMSSERRYKSVKYTRKPLRLGLSVFSGKNISRFEINSAVEYFSHFRDLIFKYQVDQYKAVATSALREAQNKEEFISEIRMKTGIDINLIEGEEEANYILKAVTHELNLSLKNSLIMDIGGGSVEFTASFLSLKNNTSQNFSLTYPMGMIRALQWMEKEKINNLESSKLSQFFGPYFVQLKNDLAKKGISFEEVEILIGTGGNCERLAKFEDMIFDRSSGKEINLLELQNITENICALTLEERVDQFKIDRDRADVLVPAAILIEIFLKELKKEKMEVPAVGLRHGIIWSLINSLYHP